jgi:hypothetical protein
MVFFLGKNKRHIWQNTHQRKKIVNRKDAEISDQTPENIFPFLFIIMAGSSWYVDF